MNSHPLSLIFSAFVLAAPVVLAPACAPPESTVEEAPAAVAAADSLPAFPGAEGWGALTSGGRGGQVLHVTNLDSEGPGSLGWAVAQPGPRIVVFDTSGVIAGDVTIRHGQLTILGQTAPGAGITIRGRLRAESEGDPEQYLTEIVVRFLRVRPDPSAGGDGSDWDAVQFNRVERVVFDHLSVAWSTDENFGLFCSRELTVQWCAVEEANVSGHYKGRHNYGLLCGPEGGRISVHHNLFANNSRRNPAIANGPSDVRNNVVYNFRDGFLHDNEPNTLGFNIIGNYYQAGPASASIYPFAFESDSARYYLRDNYIAGLGLVQDPWAEGDRHPGLKAYAGQGVKAESEFAVPPVATQGPEEAYALVLASAGGLPRDAVTSRTVREVRDSAGEWGRHAPADLLEGLTVLPAPPDADRDGIADAWEQAHGLDPADSADNGKPMPSGYTAIEEYANQLAAELIARAAGEAR